MGFNRRKFLKTGAALLGASIAGSVHWSKRAWGQAPGGLIFQINGREFDHHRVDTQVQLDTIEDWEIINMDPMDHPVHLHTNLFQILRADGEPERAWRDIMNVRAGTRQRFRVRFRDYPGTTVYHCHRVAHGDLGMMAVLDMIQTPRPARGRSSRS